MQSRIPAIGVGAALALLGASHSVLAADDLVKVTIKGTTIDVLPNFIDVVVSDPKKEADALENNDPLNCWFLL